MSDSWASTYARPEGSRWTDEQWAAIAAGGANLLVAAAAGSGKTAVLVERIISRIADERSPIDVDSLLVATFTKAAAAEMKERIRVALEDALEGRPDSSHLKKQLALLPRASVTTLHSFCMEVIEAYSPLIGLDPGFRIANETEAELLRMDTLDALFEERYGEEGEEGTLARLADRFGGERSDEQLHRLVLGLHEFSRSHPWPEAWLEGTAARFRVADAAELAATEWVGSMRADVILTLEGAAGLLREGLETAGRPGGPQPYAVTLADDLGAVESVLEAVRTGSWETWYGAFAACSFGRLKPCRGDDYDAGLQEKVKALRDEAKKAVARLAEEWFVRSPEQYAAELRAAAPDMAALAELACAFGERYETAKREKGLLDFGDLEHYALRILRDPASTPERTVPSPAALDYRKRFAEILLDEYQDTNEVQEAIVSLIARDRPGNVFMVGDVKQSIYRFRLAEPGLFLGKYKSYDVWSRGGFEGRGGSEAEEGGRGDGGKRDGATTPAPGPDSAGVRIDLARNFRSRREVVDAVNHVFRLILREKVGEMDYDRRAELIYGEGYPDVDIYASSRDEGGGSLSGAPREAGRSPYAVEMILLDRSAPEEDGREWEEEPAAEGGETDALPGAEEGLEAAQLEARCIAAEIKRLMGSGGKESGGAPFAVYDGRSKLYRPLAYRDIVILLRAATALAPAVLEELKAAGIPAYADLATGYFAATEVDVMLSMLNLIDNPDQDIPLAGVLRSPLVGLSAEQMARIRLHGRRSSFWDAVRAAAAGTAEENRELSDKLSAFLAALDHWRSFARREPLGDLLEMLYRETGYYDFVGGLPGGVQRQANLRALVDRARQFERNSASRGLFKFLRFLGRMRDTGADLGAARALGEQEDVVRVVSIHKSKGLEFPVVFVAGLGRSFNKQDLNGLFLKHKKLGFGPKLVDPETRVAYPTLPQLAIRRKLRAEMLAEEMRVLYVALTRPKEKLILIGSVKDAAKELERWSGLASTSASGLPDYAVSAANRYLDWLGPAAALAGEGWSPEGHDAGALMPEAVAGSAAQAAAASDDAGRASAGTSPARVPWKCRVVPASAYLRSEAAGLPEEAGDEPYWNLALELKPVPAETTEAGLRAYEALSWFDPKAESARLAAKTSITAMKRRLAGDYAAADSPESDEEEAAEEKRFARDEDELPDTAAGTFRLRRPRFLSENSLTPAERGSIVHLVMQHLPLAPGTGPAEVEDLLGRLVERRILTPQQREAVNPESIAAFCRTPIYERLCRAEKAWREVPFSYGIPASAAYPDAGAESADEPVLVQGVIDCLFPEEDGLVLIDYKTDREVPEGWEHAARKHRFQLERYAEAIGRILGRPVKEGFVYFTEGGCAVRLL
ncbi:UvrD-helicase domain-containing protein [Cohnella zeiphila]|uniref:ATP-dependent helicase/nuclease subunit A n=1 Tax=Cohnella zeiphila TaxID=2761120 RepID=A0A7X0SJ47_9BACL|nr:UvrD-helicase domain-containing protein [Cohnella zeiphila]MBB6729719.1 UvrD-helicase domain-containing protein [Cohnella zeiphila]